MGVLPWAQLPSSQPPTQWPRARSPVVRPLTFPSFIRQTLPEHPLWPRSHRARSSPPWGGGGDRTYLHGAWWTQGGGRSRQKPRDGGAPCGVLEAEHDIEEAGCRQRGAAWARQEMQEMQESREHGRSESRAEKVRAGGRAHEAGPRAGPEQEVQGRSEGPEQDLSAENCIIPCACRSNPLPAVRGPGGRGQVGGRSIAQVRQAWGLEWGRQGQRG